MNSSIPARHEAALRNQDRLFRTLLRAVWQKSAFYREYYADHGIREHQLAELSVSDLPFITKKVLMENFDRVVTDARLRKSQIERWLNDVRDPRQLFHGDFIVMHTSGSSGTIGIFVYSRTDWNVMNSIMAARLPQPENYPAGKTRVGFFRVAHGHFAGVTTAVHLPTPVYETLIVSVLDPAKRVIGQLERFQPHRMTGYSSSIAPLAQWALEGTLRIAPQRIFVSGDLLTPGIRQTIQQAWSAPISNLYGASESLFLGVQEIGDEAMTLMDDLNIFEILDAENNEVAPGEEGLVVITNLHNYTLPVLRYELGDCVVKGKALASGFSSIESIRPGKANDALPIVLDDGRRERLTWSALTSFYAPGLERAQFIFREPGRVHIDYAAKGTIDDEVSKEFRRILTMKGASKMPFTTKRVPSIAADPKTGKVRLVVLDDTATNEPLKVRAAPAPTAKAKGRPDFSRAEIEGSIVARFERQVRIHADRLAIKSEDRALTYDELNGVANRVAHAVLARSGESAEPIGMLLKPGIAAVVAILGILKSGKFYLPLDAGFPHARLAAIVRDVKPSFILTADAHLSSATALTEDAARVVNIDALDASIPDDDPSLTIAPAGYAYLLYTSGSSGQPKGVVQNHRNVLHQIASYTNGLGLHPEDRLTFLHSHCFSASRLDIFGALLNGAALLHFDFGEQGPAPLARWLHDEEITLMHWVPTAFRHFADGLHEAEQFPALRSIVLGSETLTAGDLELYRRHFAPDCTLVNRFGTTETGNIAWHFIDNQTALTGSAVPIGRVIDGMEVFLLGETGKQVVDGAVGEITVKSQYLPPGYWRRPELTRSAFTFDATGIGLYRTGDLGYRLPDGCLVYAGRKDSQAKIRGYRVEISEIETALLAHPAIREAAVAVGEEESGAQGDKRLVAYLVAENPPADLVEQLRAHLRASLPEYMVPATFVSLDALPLTPNGKVDRKALPASEGAVYAARSYEAPVGQIETTLAQIWAEVLKLERVGRHDNFFELGGHSLLAVSVIERMRRAGLHADIRALFVTPTVAALAGAVGGDSGIVEAPPNRIPPACEAISPEMLPLVRLSPEDIERIVGAVPRGADNVQDIYPLAPLQEGILFHHLMASKGDPYLLSARIGFDSRARLEAYLQALQAVIDRHDILRTAVLWEGLPEAVQVVWRQAPLLVEEVSLEPAAGDVAQQLAARFDPRCYRLDVRQAPLLRVFVAHDAANARWVILQLFHHLSIDHITQEVMQQEIHAHLLGQAGQLPTPLPFRNFVAQARLGVSREEHETFFRKMLGDVDEPTAPFGLTDVQGDGSGIAEARRPVDGSLARRLRERARALGVSAASVCHLAWAQVLARVSGRDDVVFGTLLFGRMQGGEGAERVLGLFINTLPVRIRVGDESVQERVWHTHTLLAQLLRHEHAPLALAQRCSAVPPPAPLFSALLNYRHSTPAAQAPTAEALQTWEGIEYLGFEERTNYPFVLSVDDLGEGFALTAQVQSPMDPARICTYMHSALERLVGALESAPATSVRNLDVLPEAERQQLLIDWNQTATDYPKDRCIHQLFEAQADETPDAAAVVFEDKQLSYAELNAKANRLAHHLIARGVGPEVLIALCLNRSSELIVALLAILKAGGAYLALDPDYPKERLSFMLEDGRVSIVITTSVLSPALPELSAEKVLLYQPESFQVYPSANPLQRAGTDNLAYVIYTSGSTGTPKGVTIPHRGVIRLVKNTNYADFNSTDIFLQFAPLSFDASTFEIWGALLNGATLVIMPSHRAALEDLADTLIRERVTTLWLTASLFHLMVDQHLDALIQLRQLLAGGDVLSVAHVEKFLAATPACRLINGYGPTENTTFTCCYSIPQDAKIAWSVPIGRPVANTQVYILDPHLNPVPIGIPGELHIGGAGLARGYLNRPELTAEKFIAKPFSDEPGARLYKTGDLARYLPDGNIEFLGRLDTQVKIRGFRIELGEIEAALMQHRAVREAVVIAREDARGDKTLVAYVVNREDVSPSELRSFLKDKLPEYMLPSAIVALDRLPLSPNGKLDRKALPAPEYRSEEAFVAPRTPNEETLAAIWAEVLKLEKIGIHDNFFDLGGHSLLATQVISRVRKTFELDIPLRALFESPTLAGLSALILRKQAEGLSDDELAQLLTEAEEHGEQPERTLDRGRK